MATKITRDVIESSLNCRYKGYLKLAGEQGSPSEYEQLMKESRERARLAATAKLLAQNKEGEVLQGSTVTPAVLRQGVPLLLDATVEDEKFCIHFDALQRAAGSSRLGDFHYRPVLFHEAERPVQQLRAQLELPDAFRKSSKKRRPLPDIELSPEDMPAPLSSRKRLGPKGSNNDPAGKGHTGGDDLLTTTKS